MTNIFVLSLNRNCSFLYFTLYFIFASICYFDVFLSYRLYWITKRAGERTGSGLMKANAWHHRADAVSSLVALIGVGNNLNLHNSYKVSLCATMFSSLRNTTMYMLIALIVFLVLEVYLCFLPITTALLNLMILS